MSVAESYTRPPQVEEATIRLGGVQRDLPIRHGTLGPDVVDITKLYQDTGHFTYDPGFTSTASCESKITFIDGDKGDPALSRLSDRSARRERHLPRDLLPAALRRAADEGAVRRGYATRSPSTPWCTSR